MTKQNKILLGAGAIGIAAYFLLRKKKSFTNFTTAEYDGCIRDFNSRLQQLNALVDQCMREQQAPPEYLEKCCITNGGIFVNGVCTVEGTLDSTTFCCGQLGGTLNGGTCVDPNATPTPPPTPPPPTPPTPPTPPPVTCGTNQLLVNGVCTCPSGYHWEISTTSTGGEIRTCVIDTPTDTVTDTDTTDTTTTIVTPPPFFPRFPIGPASPGAGGGGDKDKKEDLFDWIPWILAGITTALSVVSEQKQA